MRPPDTCNDSHNPDTLHPELDPKLHLTLTASCSASVAMRLSVGAVDAPAFLHPTPFTEPQTLLTLTASCSDSVAMRLSAAAMGAGS